MWWKIASDTHAHTQSGCHCGVFVTVKRPAASYRRLRERTAALLPERLFWHLLCVTRCSSDRPSLHVCLINMRWYMLHWRDLCRAFKRGETRLFPGVPGCTPAGLAAEMLIHHNAVISQRFARAERRHEGAMATWHRRRRADKGLARGKEELGLYWGLRRWNKQARSV